MSSTRLGLVRCEHCARQFNPHSAARHIPWCAEQQSKSRKQRLSNEKQQALERYKWRISYRPSNQMVAANSRRPQQLHNLDQRIKKSSISNSSATLSSPSASSAASFSGISQASSDHQQQRQRRRQQTQTTPIGQPYSQLKRSVSSLTLTKQPASTGTLPSRTESRLTTQSRQQQDQESDIYEATIPAGRQTRTKSVSDVSQIVETLAKRVDEIYAQNQVLLASISMGNLNRAALNDEDEDENEDTSSELGERPLRCHGCKLTCLKHSNYCHKCGCQLRQSVSESPR